LKEYIVAKKADKKADKKELSAEEAQKKRAEERCK